MENRESAKEDSKLTTEQLVNSLADQLSSGLIDPWTFKCAYMAVYPSDHPADLLHRLVELLGTQKLSGDLFRAAYEAVQAADGPAVIPQTPARKRRGKVRDDEATDASTDDLVEEEARHEADSAQAQAKQLAAEAELAQHKEQTESRLNELNSRYEELAALLQEREVELKQRSAELSQKDSENQQLKAQMEELRDQTKDLVADLQKQLTQTQTQTQTKTEKEEPAPSPKPSPGFFDISPGQSTNLFDSAPTKPLFQDLDAYSASGGSSKEGDTHNLDQPESAPAAAPSKGKAGGNRASAAPAPDLVASNQSAAGQGASVQQTQQIPGRTGPQAGGPSPYVSAAGSYGSGVRAQVFEVIVRQALAGAPWKEICAGPMQVNNISPDEVEAEVKRRQALLKK